MEYNKEWNLSNEGLGLTFKNHTHTYKTLHFLLFCHTNLETLLCNNNWAMAKRLRKYANAIEICIIRGRFVTESYHSVQVNSVLMDRQDEFGSHVGSVFI